MHLALCSAMMAQARLWCQQDLISGVNGSLRYDLRPTVMTTMRSRWKPRSIDACRTLVTFLGKATSGEFAIRRMAVENAGSERMRSHSAGKEASVPDIRFSAWSAMAGKGGMPCGSHRSCVDSADSDLPVDSVVVD